MNFKLVDSRERRKIMYICRPFFFQFINFCYKINNDFFLIMFFFRINLPHLPLLSPTPSLFVFFSINNNKTHFARKKTIRNKSYYFALRLFL